MFVSKDSLEKILYDNVCELKFIRKREKLNYPSYRRILCTRAIENIYDKNKNFLDSEAGRNILGFKRPPSMPIKRHGMTYNWRLKPNLLMVWDIFNMDWRVINVNKCNLIWTIPADSEFWGYYNLALSKMTSDQKKEFENK